LPRVYERYDLYLLSIYCAILLSFGSHSTSQLHEQFGIFPYDTKDENGGERYNPFSPGHHLKYFPPANPKEDWYSNYSINCKASEGSCMYSVSCKHGHASTTHLVSIAAFSKKYYLYCSGASIIPLQSLWLSFPLHKRRSDEANACHSVHYC
jgi:hypothetical protein